MKKYILLTALVLFSSIIYATKHSHIDENEIRYFKASPLDASIQYQLRNGTDWQYFIKTYPNWFVSFNENSKMPQRAFGEPIALYGNNLSSLESFFSSTNFILPDDLREVKVNRSSKYLDISAKQYYNNLEVIDSRFSAKLSSDNELVSFSLDVFNNINIGVNATITKESAILSSQQHINNPITDVEVDDKLKVLPVPGNGKYKFHLVYLVKYKTRIEEGPAHYICYVDANDGTLLMRKNEVLYEAPPSAVSSVKGDLYTTHPYNPSSVEDLKHLKVTNPSTGTNYYTDVNGDVNISLPTGTQVEYKLEGLYANVQTNGITPEVLSNIAATNNILFDNSNSTIQERTAYYAVNEVHDHMKNVFPAFTGLDSPLETNVDEFGTCNAYFAGSSINFYQEGLSSNGTDYCEATGKIVDVVYHEYGHAINSYRYDGGNGMWNGALNEGFADIWAFTITQDPILGIGFYQNNPNGFVRRYDVNRKVYPQDLVGEVHADGEIIAGAFWDTYLNLGSMQQTIDLFKVLYDNSPDGPDGDEGVIYTDVLVEVLFADDNDANLANGTPNDLAIIQAFALHGITLISNAVINHTPVASAVENANISISANIQLNYAWALGNAYCHYRINNDTNWSSLPMVTSGGNYTAQVPAQTNGNIIAYYISLEDTYGFESGITPFSSNKSPIHFANVPYFTLVGYDLKEEEDFDFSLGNWLTNSPSDNATTGFWDIGNPVGSYINPMDLSTVVQPGTQHTPGGSSCAYTGNASSTNASIGENDVDGGHTTLISPFYDMTSYTNPAFSYWRWFTNNTGAEPNADWWQVSITEDGSTWIPVENNLTSDISWRRFAFRVKDYIGLTSNQVQIKFVASDSTNGALSGGSLVEAAIDDLYLWDAKLSTSINDNTSILKPKSVVKVIDLLGREVDPNNIVDKTTLFYIYTDGSVEKRVITQ